MTHLLDQTSSRDLVTLLLEFPVGTIVATSSVCQTVSLEPDPELEQFCNPEPLVIDFHVDTTCGLYGPTPDITRPGSPLLEEQISTPPAAWFFINGNPNIDPWGRNYDPEGGSSQYNEDALDQRSVFEYDDDLDYPTYDDPYGNEY